MILFLISLAFSGTGQKVPEKGRAKLDTLIHMLENDQVRALAKRVSYPLERPGSVPDLRTEQDFILYYDILFDSSFKARLTRTKFDSTDLILFRNKMSLLEGDLWLNRDGAIAIVNYRSDRERAFQKALHREAEESIHPSVKDWERSIVFCETEDHLIRVDQRTDTNMRYISWNKPASISDKPALVIQGGEQKNRGTQGGVMYRFWKGKWEYRVDRVKIAPSPEQAGLFLRIFHKGEEQVSSPCKELN